MGGGNSKTAEEEKSVGLDTVVKRAASRIGKIAVTGRFHKAPKTLTDDYSVKSDVLGSGYNGSVYKATTKEGGLTYAVKDFKLGKISEEKMTELEGECEIFLSMDHPHVARLVDVYQSKEKLSLVMECMEGGELFDRVLKRKHFSEKDTADAAYQMLLSVNYIHGHGIVHRDIKLENFLYEREDSDHLKLIDFGFSKIWDPSIKMKMSCGTLAYVAPEVLAKSYTSKCDMWSLGVVVFILSVGYMPFSGPERKQMDAIKAGNFTKKESWNNLAPAARDFIGRMILVNQEERMSAEHALEHEFIKNRSELAKKAETAGIDDSTVQALRHFAEASKFRRALLSCMAWSLTNEERSELRETFLAMDKTKSGCITLKEFKECLEAKYDFTDDQVKSLFQSVDTSNTDEIHYSEFLAAMVSSRVQLHDSLLKATFRRFDTDCNGYIEANDLRKVVGDCYEGEELSKLIEEADVNKDGKISYEEFIDFARHDTSHDTRLHDVGHKLIDNEIKNGGAAGGGGFIQGMRRKVGC
jgi:calcium-dependent protein kinase